MRISSITLQENNLGISIGKRLKGKLESLEKIVIFTGGNGAGKSRFLKLLQSNYDEYKNNPEKDTVCFKVAEKDKSTNDDVEMNFTRDMIENFHIINYAHFDAKLQSTVNFSPYVIHQSKNKLKQCNYEETALNSLLYLKDLSEGYSEESNENNDYKELVEFIELAKELELEFSWDKNNKRLKIFGRELNDAKLSPGQLYALRIAVACKAHEPSDNCLFLLDEPETHLHPSLLIKIIEKLIKHFKNAQFFIATHSLPLISYLTVINEKTSVFYMENGQIIDRLRSNSEPILNNLVGTEDYQFAIRQLFVSPEEMACNRFCTECFFEPLVVKGGISGDPSTFIAEKNLKLSDTSDPVIVVDYGAGEGRLLECMIEDNVKDGYEYYAYNVNKDAADYCTKLLSETGIKGKSYFQKDELSELKGRVDRVFMINVLHEISPELWKQEFNTIAELLKKDGELIIIEREILTVGEAPYVNGYLMLTGLGDKSLAAEALFGANNTTFYRHKQKPYIIAHSIKPSGVIAAQNAHLKDVFSLLQNDAINQICTLKKESVNDSPSIDKYKKGISLAFWLNQLSCAIMCQNDIASKS